VTQSTPQRGVTSVLVTETNSHPNSPFSIVQIFPVDAQGHITIVHEMDSRVSGTTVPQGGSWSPGTALGVSTITWRENIATTVCDIQPSFKLFEMSINVVRCQPRFKRNSEANIMHLSPGITYVYINPNALGSRVTEALRAAINDWNAIGLPVTFQETSVQCGGGRCINTSIGSVPGNACADTTLLVATDGSITSSSMVFPSAAQVWNPDFLRRTANHEFAHHLGLDEQISCSTSYSLMSPVSCNASSGFPLTPPVTDSLPPDKTTYGGGPATSCPPAPQ
jgi:hypothetical protein